ncbi:ABC transporter ATP-binding protein [Rhabdothermincola sediminis]|uniref:ABC transporter ATP-binding protein n=1 Tax=Rhabdothermincola sediminis TaxID=2751370 RepID=UPI001AA0717E|nr:ABC transporter ATP-binding protein [Rhabdothermincola sediminis]
MSTKPVAAWRRPLEHLPGSRWKIVALAAISGLSGLADALALVIVVKAGLAATSGEAWTTVDTGPIKGLRMTVPTLLAVAAGLVIGSFLLSGIANWASARLTAATLFATRRRAVDAYLNTEWAVASQEREGHLQELLSTNVNKAANGINLLTTGVVSLFNFLALFVTAFVVSPLVSLVLVGTMAGMIMLLRPLQRLQRKYGKQRARAGIHFASGVSEVVSLAQEVTLFDVTDQVEARLARRARAETRPATLMSFYGSFVAEIYQAAALLMVLAGLAFIASAASGQIATLSVVVLVLLRSVTYGKNLQRINVALEQTAPYLDQLEEVLERYEAARVQRAGRPIEHIGSLAFDHVSFTYDGSHPVLSDVSFEVDHGEAVGIVGPSGAGKSTLMQLLLRLRTPTSGRYLVNGQDASSFDLDDWRSRIAVVTQEARLYDGTVADNIRFFRDQFTEDDLRRAAKMANIEADIEHWPDGFDTQVGGRGSQVSGGQRQRICIARAMIGEPDLLFLDEPTSALDMRSEALLHETLLNLKGRVTMFIIAHRLSTLQVCDRIIVLNKGRLEAFDSPRELERTNAFYEEATRLSRLP